MKKWIVPVSWQMCGTAVVEADTLDEAMERAMDDDTPLPSGEYVDGSFEVSFDDRDIIRECYNNNQQDENID